LEARILIRLYAWALMLRPGHSECRMLVHSEAQTLGRLDSEVHTLGCSDARTFQDWGARTLVRSCLDSRSDSEARRLGSSDARTLRLKCSLACADTRRLGCLDLDAQMFGVWDARTLECSLMLRLGHTDAQISDLDARMLQHQMPGLHFEHIFVSKSLIKLCTHIFGD
jgi:hypothetical protein